MKLYNSYCYNTLQNVADSIQSNLFIGDGFVITNVQVLNATDIQITSTLRNMDNFYTVTPPDCTSLGFDNSYTGITTSDAVFYGSEIAAVFVLAFTIKVIKRVL